MVNWVGADEVRGRKGCAVSAARDASKRDTSSGDSRWVPRQTSCSCILRVRLRWSTSETYCRCDRSVSSRSCVRSCWCRWSDATSTDWNQLPGGTQWSSCTSTSTVRQHDVAESGSDRGPCNSAASAKLRRDTERERHQFDIEKALD